MGSHGVRSEPDRSAGASIGLGLTPGPVMSDLCDALTVIAQASPDGEDAVKAAATAAFRAFTDGASSGIIERQGNEWRSSTGAMSPAVERHLCDAPSITDIVVIDGAGTLVPLCAGSAAMLLGGADVPRTSWPALRVLAIGSGILETRALNAFLPRLCQAMLGTTLELPTIATWWCGQDAERRHVLDNFERMMIGPAFSTTLAIEDREHTMLGATLDNNPRETLKKKLLDEGSGFVGQEPVTLSTAPVYIDGRLEPRPITLRVYAARTAKGWTIMPGGFARVGSTPDTAAIAMQRGGQAADVWVVSSKPVERISLLPQEGEKLIRNSSGSLPSRAADNLIWLGRYAERCEATVRILRAYNARLAEMSNPDLPLLADTRTYLDSIDVDAAEALPHGLLTAIDSAVHSAGQIRDRFSPDGWLALADLRKTSRNFAARVQPGDDATRAMTVLLRKLAGFSGLVHENMYRFAGWRFLEIGRRLERGIQIAGITRWLTRKDAPDGALDMLLEIGDSVMTHRRRYNVAAGANSYIDLLVLDPLNPRSVLFQVAELREQIEKLPGGVEDGQLSVTAKAVLELHTQLRVAEPEDMTSEHLTELSIEIGRLAGLIADAYFV